MKTKNYDNPIYWGLFFLLTGIVLFGISKFSHSPQIEDFTEINATLLNSPRLSETRSDHELQQRIYISTREYSNVSFLIGDKTYHVDNAERSLKLKPNDNIYMVVQLEDLEKVKSNPNDKKIVELYGLRTENEVFYTLKDKIEFDKNTRKNMRFIFIVGGLGLIIYGIYKNKLHLSIRLIKSEDRKR